MTLANGQYRVEGPVLQNMTDTGLIDGPVVNFNGNYSVTPEDAIYMPPPGFIATVHNIHIAITDTGAFLPTDYGNIAGLTNGLLPVVEINGVEVVNTESAVKTNNDLFVTDASAQIVEFASNQRTLIARFDFESGIVLNGNTADKFIFRLSDDFTGLQTHEFVVVGQL